MFTRTENSRLPKAVFYGELKEGSRKVGAPRLRYKDAFKRHLKNINEIENWREKAEDRLTWRCRCHQKKKCTVVGGQENAQAGENTYTCWSGLHLWHLRQDFWGSDRTDLAPAPQTLTPLRVIVDIDGLLNKKKTAKKATLNWRETIDDLQTYRLFVNVTLALDWKLSVVMRLFSNRLTL